MRKLIEIKSPLPPFIKGGESNYLPCKGGGAQQRRVLIKNPPFLLPVLDYPGCPKTQRFRTPYGLTPCRKSAFTLAEVLITLGIIGVVAAMTLPALVGNYQKKQAVTQLQKVYTVLNQAFRQSEADNASSLYWDTSKGSKVYFDTYWKPYLKVLRYCTGASGESDCNYNVSQPWYRANGLKDAYWVVNDGSRTTFVLSDGTFVSILAYSGYGSTEGSSNADGSIVGNTTGTDPRIIVDLNASKTPNKFGRDTFLLQRVAGKGVMPYGYNEDDDTVNDNCSKTGSGFMCAAKLMREGWDMKDDYPW